MPKGTGRPSKGKNIAVAKKAAKDNPGMAVAYDRKSGKVDAKASGRIAKNSYKPKRKK